MAVTETERPAKVTEDSAVDRLLARLGRWGGFAYWVVAANRDPAWTHDGRW